MGPRQKIVTDTPDHCSILLKESLARKACLCIHHATNQDFGGWLSCANASTSSGRDHAVKDIFLSEYNKYACAALDSGLMQKTTIKPVQRTNVFRRRDKKIEGEMFKFCHLQETSDHARCYREWKHGSFIEKIPDKADPLRQLQLRENFQDIHFEDAGDTLDDDGIR